MDFKKRAEDCYKFITNPRNLAYAESDDIISMQLIEKALKEAFNAGVEESAKRAGDFDEDWIGDKIRELKEPTQ